VALFYLIAGGLMGGERLVLRLIVFLILPMACIWFGDAIGSVTGPTTIFLSGGPAITKETPGCAVVIAGWILLLMPLAAAIYLAANV
jgi:hypothetical protein